MTPIMNSLACLFALLPSYFLWSSSRSIARQGVLLALVLCSFMIFTFLVGDMESPLMEFYPLKMWAFCLCVSTLTLTKKQVFFMSLAQGFWLWILFFGSLSLAYRGETVSYLSMILLLAGILFVQFFKNKPKEISLGILIYWVGIWMLF
ncbi:MAG TPA: hypothetical protein PLT31_08345 [Fibrobacteraceae bacterium]|jgi:hypothetical protein|nr:hypothetical protein [Fibrobacter sp.]HOG68315.1 hypothetical protein [Fibrobacteraceae bacterium]HPW95177.1 hypothetical protein [Fibrobacteraceae bacterium]HQB64411.1 hypothetical protein [Fibrobacteraceae bacterium]